MGGWLVLKVDFSGKLQTQAWQFSTCSFQAYYLGAGQKMTFVEASTSQKKGGGPQKLRWSLYIDNLKNDDVLKIEDDLRAYTTYYPNLELKNSLQLIIGAQSKAILALPPARNKVRWKLGLSED